MGDRNSLMLHNVLVMVLADGKVTDAEKAFVRRLRERLGIDSERFNEAVRAVKAGHRKIKMPADRTEAAEVVRLLAEAAAVDGGIAPIERRALEAMARHIQMPPSSLDGLMAASENRDTEKLSAMLDEVYDRFGEWDDRARREHFAAIAAFGRYAVLGLLRMLESYRVAAGEPNALAMKERVVETLADIGDERAVYYLATQTTMTGTDEITNPALQAAAAEAVGRITGEGFTRDAAGAEAARAWWFDTGTKRYDTLAL